MTSSAYMVVLAYSLAFAAMAMAAVTDARQRIIPDRYVLIVAGAGVAVRILDFDGFSLLFSLAIAFGALVLLGQLARLDMVGGGDAKLIAASSLLFAPSAVPFAIASIALAGGLLAIAYLLKEAASRAGREHQCDAAIPAPRGSLPYGVAILLGTLAVTFLEVFRQCSTVESCSP